MNVRHHRHTVEEEARNREATFDRTIEDSFPASDPPPSIPNPDDDERDLLDHVDELGDCRDQDDSAEDDRFGAADSTWPRAQKET